MKTPDDLKTIDPCERVRGSVGEAKAHSLTTVRTIDIMGKDRQLMRESLCVDNYGNEYLAYIALLPDGEVYEVCDWVRPSIILKYGGWTDALIDDYRAKAEGAFAAARVHGKFSQRGSVIGK